MVVVVLKNLEEYNPMGKDLRPKAKQYRRLGIKPETNAGASSSVARAVAKRSYPPGIHGPKGFKRLTDYALHLQEKQKIRLVYGVLEKQLKKYFKEAMDAKENTGLKLMELLERRLDNVIFRAGLATTRRQARQLVNHRHFLVNDKKMDIPSYLVKSGDTISIKKDKSREKGPIAESLKGINKHDAPEWIAWDESKQQVKVLHLPQEKNLELGFDTRLIVEYYSK